MYEKSKYLLKLTHYIYDRLELFLLEFPKSIRELI